MKTVVVYKSKSGFVKKYAEWIAEELLADIYEASEIKIDNLIDYDTIIYGGGLYAVGINGIKIIKQNFNKLSNKNIIVFTSGASPGREEIIDEVLNNNFTQEQKRNLQFYYFRGGFDFNKLRTFDKFLMILMKIKLKSKKSLEPDEKGMLLAYDNPVDFTKKKNIQELLDYVRTLENCC